MRIVQSLFMFFVISCSLVSGLFLSLSHNRCIDFSPLEQYNPGKPTILLDDAGNEWARFQLDRRKPIAYHDMPKHLIHAFLAIEDRSFFEHHGISYKGVLRSLWVNIYYGRIVQGASTITQQLVKLLFTDSSRTFSRKIKDQIYALLVEQQFTKEQILETYLNHVFFGCGIYGVEAAAQRFWGVTASALSLDQAATLAGIVKNPGRYCPLLFPLSSKNRRDVVLAKMSEVGFISMQQKEDAQSQEMTLYTLEDHTIAPHAKEYIRQCLEATVGKKRVYTGGLTVQTTINRAIQKQAEKEFVKKVSQLKKKIDPDVDGALITLHVRTGEVKALVGGYDFKTSKFNRALQAKRQLGSVFKSIVFAAAVEKGIRFNEVEVDEPIEVPMSKNNIWRPRNYDQKFHGEMTLAYALSRSNNIVPIKICMRIGIQTVIDCAQRCQLEGPFYPFPSLALGCVDTTVQEAAAMFNLFANNGTWVQPYCIRWIKDEWGNKLYKQRPKSVRSISSQVSGQVVKVLGIGLDRVRKLFPQQWPDTQAISKTGTTNDSRTCWFVGSTPEYTTAVYIGCDDNRSMGQNTYPLHTAFPIWIGLHRSIVYKQKHFIVDPLLKELTIDEKTGALKDAKQSGAITIYV